MDRAGASGELETIESALGFRAGIAAWRGSVQDAGARRALLRQTLDDLGRRTPFLRFNFANHSDGTPDTIRQRILS